MVTKTQNPDLPCGTATEREYVYRSTSFCLNRNSLFNVLAFLFEPHSDKERKALEGFSIAVCDLCSDLHDDVARFNQYMMWLRNIGQKTPMSIKELGALAERIEEHLEAAQALGMNPCD